MSTLRIHKKPEPVVVLDSTCLNDEALSWGAKGLHSYLMALPDNAQVRAADLMPQDTVPRLLTELEDAGYIKKNSIPNGAEGAEYLVWGWFD